MQYCFDGVNQIHIYMVKFANKCLQIQCKFLFLPIYVDNSYMIYFIINYITMQDSPNIRQT